MSVPLVSIITPSYNRADFIESCLRSVKNQRYAGIEHIVIDGGSTDTTINLLHKYENLYNLKWISEPDEGMYYAINKGINMARGEIVAYLNTDDAYFPWSVEVAVRKLLGGAQLVYGDLCMIKRTNSLETCYLQFYKPFTLTFYTHFATIAQPTVFLKKNIFEKIGMFDTSYRLLGDCEFWLRCARNSIIPQKINEILAVQIDHGETLRERRKLLLQEEFLKLRSAYRVSRIADLKLIGRIQNGISSRIIKLSFFVHYWFNGGKDWENLRRYLKSNNVNINIYKSLVSLMPGFILQGFAYSPIQPDIIMRAINQ